MNTVLFMTRNFVSKVLLSGRFLVALAVLFLSNYMTFQIAVEQMRDFDYTIGPLELVPFYMSSHQSVLMYYLFTIFLVSAYPRWEGSQGEILRLGKRRWLGEQFFYTGLTITIQYIVLTLSFIAALFPQIQWNNSWSELVQGACDNFEVMMGLGLNVALEYEYGVTQMGSPLALWFYCFLLHLGCGMVLGMLEIILNIKARRGTGTAAIAGITLLRAGMSMYSEGSFTFWQKAWDFLRHFHPLIQSDLNIMAAGSGTPYMLRYAAGITYFLVLFVVVCGWGMKMVQNVDLTAGS